MNKSGEPMAAKPRKTRVVANKRVPYRPNYARLAQLALHTAQAAPNSAALVHSQSDLIVHSVIALTSTFPDAAAQRNYLLQLIDGTLESVTLEPSDSDPDLAATLASH